MKPLHFRLISLIFLLIGANIEALQSEQNDRVDMVLEFQGYDFSDFEIYLTTICRNQIKMLRHFEKATKFEKNLSWLFQQR